MVKEQIIELKSKLELLEKLLLKFPDIKEYRGRWNTYYTSNEVDKIADQVEYNYSCGCCQDSILYAKPYIEYLNCKIYTTKPEIPIGQKNYEESDTIFKDWEKRLKEAGITSEKTYFIIREYISKKEKTYAT